MLRPQDSPPKKLRLPGSRAATSVSPGTALPPGGRCPRCAPGPGAGGRSKTAARPQAHPRLPARRLGRRGEPPAQPALRACFSPLGPPADPQELLRAPRHPCLGRLPRPQTTSSRRMRGRPEASVSPPVNGPAAPRGAGRGEASAPRDRRAWRSLRSRSPPPRRIRRLPASPPSPIKARSGPVRAPPTSLPPPLQPFRPCSNRPSLRSRPGASSCPPSRPLPAEARRAG